MNYKLKIYPKPIDVAEAFAEDFKETVDKHIYENGIVNISLSGGSTPKLLFDILASEYSDKIDWSNVHFFWGDERCVPPTDKESNYGMTNEHLLKYIDIPEENIHRIKGENEPVQEVLRYSEEIKSKFNNLNPVFDLMILGMGDDGHTASIFPNNIHLWKSENICEVSKHPATGQNRITITGSIINHSKKIVFLITGKNKADVLNKILAEEGGYLDYPSALVKPISGELLFYIDKDATAKFSDKETQ